MPTYSPFDWYETPLYYDIIFDVDTQLESDFLETIIKRYGQVKRRANQPVRLLEPACGSGRLVVELASRGYKVTGFDLSDGMLAFAEKRLRKAGLTAAVVNADMANFKFKQKFDAALCVVSTFKYLLTEEDARSHLHCIAEALKPGGIYMLGFHLTEDGQNRCERERWVGQRGKTKVVCNIQSWPPDRRKRLERVRSRLIVTEPTRANGPKTKHYESQWHFRTYNPRQVHSMLAAVPQLEHVATHNFSYNPLESHDNLDERLDCVLILRKPA